MLTNSSVVAPSLAFVLAIATATPPVLTASEGASAERHPDLSGTYDISTLTPLQRPAKLGDRRYLTEEEAWKIKQEEDTFREHALSQSSPDREAPPEGGATAAGLTEEEFPRESLGAGSVGGYNVFWIDRGTDTFQLDGKFATSILYDPPDGRFPAMTAQARASIAERAKLRRPNTGEAWWLEVDGPGPYDGPESLGLAERCLLGFSGNAPVLPGLYNNQRRIIQTADRVMILVEMVHDARVVRMNEEHAPRELRFWLGDSVGRWDGDTLVIDTANFRADNALRGASENVHVVERIRRIDDNHLLYDFTVDDPTVWTAPWSGQYVWPSSDNKVYEYACHEGNYAMQGILKGARLLEADARKGSSDSEE